MILLRFVLIRNSQYDAENDDNFPKIPAGSFAQKNGWNNITLEYNYTEITQAYYFHIFYHRCGEYLKFCKYFGWILFSNIGKYSFSFKVRMNFRKFISLTLNFIIKWQRLKICFKAVWKYAILPKRWVYFSIFELLSNITEHYFIFEHFSFYK